MNRAVGLDDRLRASAWAEFREVEGIPVLFNVENGKYFGMEGVAVEIWRAVEDGLTLRQTAERIIESYDVPLEQCQKDVLQFARTLCNSKLLEIVPA